MGDAGAGEANLTGVMDASVDSCMNKDLICEEWIGKIRNKIKEDQLTANYPIYCV